MVSAICIGIRSKEKDCYVHKKHDNLKGEIWNYEFLNIEDFDGEIAPKARENLKTKIVRIMKTE